MALLEKLRELDGVTYSSRDGKARQLRLLPPLSSSQLERLTSELPCPLPEEVRQTFLVSAGVAGAEHVAETVDLSGLSQSGQYLEDFSPHALCIATDECGNGWSLDLGPASQDWGPVFFLCHDPPVVVYQCARVEEFLDQLRLSPRESDLGDRLQAWVERIWGQNPGVLTAAQASQRDAELAAFAAELGDAWEFVDLRQPEPGQGFSWGRYGANTRVRRHPTSRILAIQPPPKKPSLFRRLFGRGG